MQIVDDFVSSGMALDRCVVGIGVFDGVHLAHQQLIETVVGKAREQSTASVVLTFEPHPQEVIRQTAIPRLMSLERRLALLEAMGVDLACVIRFSRNVARITAEEFVQKSLVGRLHALAVVVGFNFTFGQGARGTPKTLAQMGEDLGFQTITIPPVVHGGIAVSSSSVRGLIEQGEVARAAQLLGRPYTMTGSVVKGEGRGQTLGFPTANLSLTPASLVRPRRGVYLARAVLGLDTYKAVVNVGVAPTFHGDDAPVRIEAHLLGLSEDILGRWLELELTRLVREERRFSSAGELADQIAMDVALARDGGDRAAEGAAAAQQMVAAPQHEAARPRRLRQPGAGAARDGSSRAGRRP